MGIVSECRIGLCGASGTGKSKLVAYLADKLQLPVNPIGSRHVSKLMGFDNPYDVDKHGLRSVFQRRLFAEKRAWELAHDSFVTDRTMFDNLAYASMHNGVSTLTVDDLDAYVEAMRRYTLVVYLPLHRFQNLGDDPMRVDSVGYHRIYDVILRGFLREHRILYFPLECEPEHRRALLDQNVR
jgi:predicted ATPase